MHKTRTDSLLNVERQPKKMGFNLFLKTLVSEMVRSSSGREFHDAEPETENMEHVTSSLYSANATP